MEIECPNCGGVVKLEEPEIVISNGAWLRCSTCDHIVTITLATPAPTQAEYDKLNLDPEMELAVVPI